MSRVENELTQLTISINQIVSNGEPLDPKLPDILVAAEKLPITVELLRTTKIGLAINSIKKKFPGQPVASKAKDLLARWRKECETLLSIPERSSKREKKTVTSYNEDALAESTMKVPPIPRTVGKVGKITIKPDQQPLPTRNKTGELAFPDHPEFKPNLTPKQVMQMGSFGGTYFRTIHSGVTGETYTDAWKEFPADWFEKMNIKRQVSSSVYDASMNMYGSKCGGDLHMWESSGWITEIDPFGWFQWYCRFYLGRRCSDDARQISRALGVMGPKGRWRNNLVNKCIQSGQPTTTAVEDRKISPVVRQLLQHWGYKLTEKDLLAGIERNKSKR